MTARGGKEKGANKPLDRDRGRLLSFRGICCCSGPRQVSFIVRVRHDVVAVTVMPLTLRSGK